LPPNVSSKLLKASRVALSWATFCCWYACFLAKYALIAGCRAGMTTFAAIV